ncbi:hypothetical protein C942_03763 [Photobacterium marinum]|uniref:Uncharacterized protein n=1 Tax=Photobacterium marinum TaxID=1056511 RepID=L8J3N5_9GAMM|nr:hypothetical protein C942_03763 [Photobacterium marinum]
MTAVVKPRKNGGCRWLCGFCWRWGLWLFFSGSNNWKKQIIKTPLSEWRFWC